MTAINTLPSLDPGNADPAANMAAITPNDDADLTYVSRALYFGTSGNVTAVTFGGQTVTIAALAGGLLPLRVVRVLATGTTASSIFALW